jgi:hypothetical protein
MSPQVVRAICTLLDEFLENDFPDRIDYLRENPETYGDLADRLDESRDIFEEWQWTLPDDLTELGESAAA